MTNEISPTPISDDNSTASRLWLEGAKASIPIILTAGPFGALFGALAVESGLSVFDATMMSALVFAGASQLVGIELFGQNIPGWIIVLSIFAVNFRHILYSAAIGPHISHWSVPRQMIGFFFLIDPSYAEAERRVEKRKSVDFSWYLGLMIPTYLVWVAVSWVGAVLGNILEDSYKWGIDFMLPIYFLGLVMGFRKRSFWLPVVVVSATASILASKTIGSPWHVSIGAIAGILFAAFFSPDARNGETQKEGANT